MLKPDFLLANIIENKLPLFMAVKKQKYLLFFLEQHTGRFIYHNIGKHSKSELETEIK